MALHRDIFWIGRQWAVTGHGMQLIDQRLEGAFDIEAARLGDDDLIEGLRAKAWLKAEDFDKGLAVARAREWQPQAASEAAPPSPAIESISPPLPTVKPETPKLETPKPEQPAPTETPYAAEPPGENPPPEPAKPSKQQSPELSMTIDGRARFARPWRVWMKRKT
jgi:hypothetical protein